MNIQNFFKNFGLKSAGIITVLLLLLLLLIYLYTQKLLPIWLSGIWAIGCIVMIGLNLYDRGDQIKKMGDNLLGKAEDLFKKGEIKGAMRDYNRSLDLKGPSWGAYLGLGHCYKALNDHKKALEYAKKALECKDDSAAALYLMGICLFRQDYHDSAIKHLEKALQITPDLTDCYMMIGEIYASLGKKEDALKSYSKYLESAKDPKIVKTVKEKIEKLKA